MQAYQNKYGSAPRSGHSLNNYVGAKVILEALGKASDFEPDTIVETVKSIDIEPGVTAAGYGFKFGENNQNERAEMTGMQWQNGELVTVYPDSAAIVPIKYSE